jgi:hypothetical protein
VVPIFARRVLQRLLDATDHILTPEQRDNRLTNLNAANERSLHTEWEVTFSYVLSSMGTVQYEVQSEGGSKPDVSFRNRHIEFIAEIRTVSDRGYEDANQREGFEREFWRRLRRAELVGGGFHYQIEGKERSGKMQLLLPRDGRWNDLFDVEFSAFLDAVKQNPGQFASLRRRSDVFDVAFSYTPGQNTNGGGYPSYRYSKRDGNSPVFNALRRKRERLKAAGYEGLRGIILCDGGCEQLRHPDLVVRKFFEGTESIAFVVVATLTSDRFSRVQYPLRVSVKFYVNSFLSGEMAAHLRDIFVQGVATLPDARDDVVNARNHLRSGVGHLGLSHAGGYYFSAGGYMRISSRALHELLAGKLSSEKFFELHRMDSSRPGTGNQFAYFLEQGKMISAITVERDEAEDDDWLVIEFTDRDPAISDFRAPKQH